MGTSWAIANTGHCCTCLVTSTAKTCTFTNTTAAGTSAGTKFIRSANTVKTPVHIIVV